LAVVHLNTLLRGIHLMPMYGSQPLPCYDMNHYNSLDIFSAFYVNRLGFADYHSNKIFV
ncbi:hypothetical protein DFJ43DRAFT_994349, partial [Lentinula guzmanii]